MFSIIDVDMDAFYASVEKLDNSDLKDRPLIVGGMGKRGVASTYNFTGIPRLARYFFICLMVYFPKCTIEATRTASACPSVMAS